MVVCFSLTWISQGMHVTYENLFNSISILLLVYWFPWVSKIYTKNLAAFWQYIFQIIIIFGFVFTEPDILFVQVIKPKFNCKKKKGFIKKDSFNYKAYFRKESSYKSLLGRKPQWWIKINYSLPTKQKLRSNHEWTMTKRWKHRPRQAVTLGCPMECGDGGGAGVAPNGNNTSTLGKGFQILKYL